MKVQSIERAFYILEYLSKKPDGLGLTEISQRLELPKSTVYRMLSVLRKHNYIAKNDKTNVYKLGLGFLELTSIYIGSLELKTEAWPYLKRLSLQTSQVVFLGIEQDNELVFIDRYDPGREINKYAFIGQRHPLYCTALGKSILIGYSDAQIRAVFSENKLKKFTPNTITKIDKLIEDINISRERMYSIDNEEHEEGVVGIAAPIYDYRGIIIAAVSTPRDNSLQVPFCFEKTVEFVKAAAYDISMSMGYIKKKNGSYMHNE